MITNYSKIAVRHLWRSKLYSGINVFGLAVGVACMLLAILFVKDEYSYDDFHKNGENLYRVTTTLRTVEANDLHTVGGTGQVQGPAFKQAVPEIQKMVRVLGGDIYGDIEANNKTLKQRMLFVDDSFFDVFSFPLINGNAQSALSHVNSVVITESVAKKYFNRTDVVGELLVLPDDPSARKLGKPMIVSAVAKDPPTNSSIQFDVLFPMSFGALSFTDENWLNAYLGTYVVLQPETDNNKVIEKFNDVYKKFAGDQLAEHKKAYGFDPGVQYGLQKITDIHLNPLLKFSGNREAGVINESKPVFSYLFLGIAAFILLMATINFINISIAGSLRRAKEVGVRKVTGGSKWHIVAQFITESALLCIVSFVLALVFMQAALPVFNEFSGKRIVFAEAFDAKLIFWLLALLLVIVLSTSLYPSYLLSEFKPTEVLYQKQRLIGNRLLGRALVVFQFSLAVFFVIVTIIYYSQLSFIQTKDLGYNPDNTIYTWTKGTGKLSEIQNRLRAELATEPSIKVIAYGSDGISEEVLVDGKKLRATHKIGDEYLLKAAEISLKAGRNFSAAYPTDKAKSVIVNEAFVKAAGLASPLGAQVKTGEYYDKETKTIIGVVKDFHFESLREPIKPMVIIMSDWASGGIWVRFEKEKNKEALSALEKAYQKVMPGTLFEYQYVDEYTASEYKQEQRWKKIVGTATILSLLICCLGLFGLSHLATQQRVKEIGIRKVLGASVMNIAQLVSRDFLRLVIVSLVIASPLAAWAMHQWLQNYSYRITIDWWIFAIAGCTTIFIAAATVSIQAIKAALADPVESLRNE